MLIKPKYTPADPTSVCKTCVHHDPNLQVCCANDVAVSDDIAKTKCCSDWDPKHICITCEHFDPDTNQCWFEEHDMSEEESLTRTCESWEPRKEKLNVFSVRETIGITPVNPVKVPLQPDGSLKMKAKETIGCHIVNGDGITWATLRTRYCGNCLHQAGDEMCPDPGEPSNEGCKNWEPREEKSAGWDHRLEAKALDRGAKQGMTLEALETVFAVACQQVPSMEQRWMELKGEINLMFAQKWAAEDTPE